MSTVLKTMIKAEAVKVGFKPTDMNDKLFEAIAQGVSKYLNTKVLAAVSGGSSSGTHKLVAS